MELYLLPTISNQYRQVATQNWCIVPIASSLEELLMSLHWYMPRDDGEAESREYGILSSSGSSRTSQTLTSKLLQVIPSIKSQR